MKSILLAGRSMARPTASFVADRSSAMHYINPSTRERLTATRMWSQTVATVPSTLPHRHSGEGRNPVEHVVRSTPNVFMLSATHI
jgi:hypothetical protein